MANRLTTLLTWDMFLGEPLLSWLHLANRLSDPDEDKKARPAGARNQGQGMKPTQAKGW